MIVTMQKREVSQPVILSEAKDLIGLAPRSFPFDSLRASAPALRMTGPKLVVKPHNRRWAR